MIDYAMLFIQTNDDDGCKLDRPNAGAGLIDESRVS